MSIYLKTFLRFCLLVLLQVAVLNKVPLRWWAEPMGFPIFLPMIYPLLILLLPFNTPQYLVYLLSFACGLTIDMYSNTMGMHALALLMLGAARPITLNALLPKKLEEYGGQAPNTKNMGWLPFLTYASILLLIHHLVYFLVSLWSLENIGYLLLKTVASTATSVLLVLSFVLLFGQHHVLKKKVGGGLLRRDKS